MLTAVGRSTGKNQQQGAEGQPDDQQTLKSVLWDLWQAEGQRGGLKRRVMAIILETYKNEFVQKKTGILGFKMCSQGKNKQTNKQKNHF